MFICVVFHDTANHAVDTYWHTPCRHYAFPILRAGSEPLAALPPRAREIGHPRSSEFCPRGWGVCRPAKGVIRCRGIASTPAVAGGRGADPTWIWSEIGRAHV